MKDIEKKIKEKAGVKESDTGLAPSHLWDIVGDRQRLSEEHPLQVARCTKIIKSEKQPRASSSIAGVAGSGAAGAAEEEDDDDDDAKYVINLKQIAKFVVGLGERVSPTDIEEGMRVGVDLSLIHI